MLGSILLACGDDEDDGRAWFAVYTSEERGIDELALFLSDMGNVVMLRSSGFVAFARDRDGVARLELAPGTSAEDVLVVARTLDARSPLRCVLPLGDSPQVPDTFDESDCLDL